MNERGFSLLELLVAVAIGTLVLLGFGQLYLLAAHYGRMDDSLTYMHRQGTVILDEMARQIRAGTDLKCSPAGCDPITADTLASCGVDPSLQVTTAAGVYCYRLNAAGGNQLIEARPGGGTYNMLRDSQAPLVVSACPDSSPMFSVANPGNAPGCSPTTTPCAPPNRADVCFRLTTTSTTSPDSTVFRASFTRRN